MARQQRTNYKRQRLQPGAPKLIVPLTWDAEWINPVTLRVTVDGSFEDITINGEPPFVLAGWGGPAPTMTINLPTIDLVYGAAVPLSSNLSLAEPWFGMGNTYGAYLAASTQRYTKVNTALVQIEVTAAQITSAFTLDLTASGIGGPTAYISAPAIIDLTTGNPLSVSALAAPLINMNDPLGGLVAGNVIQLGSNDSNFFNNTGGWLQAFSVVSS